ncbi:Reverse transcriptase domain-containing protein [Aphis craccivora]|uniref:Reverse transcriptase domain-containing protein n=1 Tax=Aphis craccivora TaxID=307492 RepID=A0A6G0YTM9_APHCR|nr:Reverse transcriptase domain-containing protein [Aphis craccivora]
MADDRTHVEAWRRTAYSIIIEGMIKGTRSRGRPRTRYISKIMQYAGITSYRELKNMVNDREKWRSHLL